jgi:hypothetical protein
MLPEYMDFSDKIYREQLREVFREHRGKVSEFEHFFQAQICWDETMAMKVAEYLNRHGEKTMVVLAGSGHVAYGRGIPDRVSRYGRFTRAILLNSTGEVPEPEAGDFFLFPAEKEEPFSAKLGVLIEDADHSLVIKKVMPGSPAAKGGIEAGDKILKIDNNDVHNISDLRLELFFKQKGDKAMVTVERMDKDMDEKHIMTFEIGPLEPFSFRGGAPHGPMRKVERAGGEESHKGK